MSKVKLGDYDVVNNNYDYILLARENGFFQDGWDLDDIATCSDWVVAHWIDELGEKKFDKERFEKEILPTFERWQHKNKIDSTGVGRYYDFITFFRFFKVLLKESLEENKIFSPYMQKQGRPLRVTLLRFTNLVKRGITYRRRSQAISMISIDYFAGSMVSS